MRKYSFSFCLPHYKILLYYNNFNSNRLDYSSQKTEYGNLFLFEPIFVPRSSKPSELTGSENFTEDPEEDDGVILTVALSNLNPNHVALIILHAKTMTELAIAEFHTSGEVAPTFHGIWTSIVT